MSMPAVKPCERQRRSAPAMRRRATRKMTRRGRSFPGGQAIYAPAVILVLLGRCGRGLSRCRCGLGWYGLGWCGGSRIRSRGGRLGGSRRRGGVRRWRSRSCRSRSIRRGCCRSRRVGSRRCRLTGGCGFAGRRRRRGTGGKRKIGNNRKHQNDDRDQHAASATPALDTVYGRRAGSVGHVRRKWIVAGR